MLIALGALFHLIIQNSFLETLLFSEVLPIMTTSTDLSLQTYLFLNHYCLVSTCASNHRLKFDIVFLASPHPHNHTHISLCSPAIKTASFDSSCSSFIRLIMCSVGMCLNSLPCLQTQCFILSSPSKDSVLILHVNTPRPHSWSPRTIRRGAQIPLPLQPM